MLMSDAQVADLPIDASTGRDVLLAHGVRLLVPDDAIDVPPTWTMAFPDAPPEPFDGLDQDRTAVAVGRAIAGLTGQSLTPR